MTKSYHLHIINKTETRNSFFFKKTFQFYHIKKVFANKIKICFLGIDSSIRNSFVAEQGRSNSSICVSLYNQTIIESPMSHKINHIFPTFNLFQSPVTQVNPKCPEFGNKYVFIGLSRLKRVKLYVRYVTRSLLWDTRYHITGRQDIIMKATS